MADHKRGQVAWRFAALAGVLGTVGLWVTFAARPFFMLSGQANATDRPEYAIVLVSMVVGAIAVAALVVAAGIAAFSDSFASQAAGKVETTRGSRRPKPA